MFVLTHRSEIPRDEPTWTGANPIEGESARKGRKRENGRRNSRIVQRRGILTRYRTLYGRGPTNGPVSFRSMDRTGSFSVRKFPRPRRTRLFLRGSWERMSVGEGDFNEGVDGEEDLNGVFTGRVVTRRVTDVPPSPEDFQLLQVRRPGVPPVTVGVSTGPRDTTGEGQRP